VSGYDVFFADFREYDIGPFSVVFKKIAVLRDAFTRFPSAKWLWWLDFDAIIMTSTIPLGHHILNPSSLLSKMRKNETIDVHVIDGSSHVSLNISPDPDPNDINFIISEDVASINAGSFFIRRSDWAEIVLDLWMDPLYRDFVCQEQDAIIHMIANHRFVSDHVALVPQRTINSYATVDGGEMWQEGDLAVHFAGCG